MKSYKEKLAAITTFIFDVDGVLTDGKVHFYKDEQVRSFNMRDCFAINYAAKMEYQLFIITKGDSQTVEKQLLDFGATEVCLNAVNKLHVYDTLKSKYEFTDEEVVYMGDDIPDYNVLKVVGVSTCPQDAAPEIKQICDYQSPYSGGNRCVRDIIEQTLRVQGKWFSIGKTNKL